MKRTMTFLLALILVLDLCACGRAVTEPEQTPPPVSVSGSEGAAADPGAAIEQPPEALPAGSGQYRRISITADNWGDYFELREIPLYTVSQGDVIAQVCQNYCVVLREEYLPLLRPEGAYRVDFSFTFDLYIDTLDVNTDERIYRHTDDLFYAVEATKPARFDRMALTAGAYGGDAAEYGGFANAFFTGYATMHPDYKIWSGFYIDLDQVKLESVSGYLELGA